jgi:opacity protein-like surface antigen
MTLHLNRSLVAILFSFAYLASPSAFAYKVKDISGKKLLIDLEGEKLFAGDTVMSINKTPEGPEILGSAKVLQVRDKQAIALISDGKFIIGKKIARKGGGNSPTEIAIQEKKPVATRAEPEYAEDEEIYETADQRRARLKNSGSDGIIFRKDMIKVALIGSFTQDKISAKQADDTLPFPVEETVPMAGSNSGIGLSFDYPSRWGVTLRGVLLNEKLSVIGTSVDDNVCAGRTSSSCLANINYISAGGHLRFDYNISRFTLWAAGGMVFKFPTSRETTSLRQDDIAVANAIVGSGGFDFAFSNRFFMPFAYEYHYSLNKSNTVPIIDHSAFMVGLGVKF